VRSRRRISISSTGRTGVFASSPSLLCGRGIRVRSRGLLILAMLASALLLLGGAYAQKAAAAGCLNEAFRTGFASGLPDCRAYELVSPADKGGASASGVADNLVAAQNGPGITFFSHNGSNIPVTGVGSTGDYPTLLARRGPESWTTQSLLTPQALGEKAAFLGITPDLRYDVVQTLDTDYGHPGYGRGLYLIDTTTEAVTTIVPAAEDEAESPYAFDGASEDGSKIFFETATPLTPGAQGQDNLYMWDRATGGLSLVGVLPEAEGGEAPVEGSFGGAYQWFEGNSAERENVNSGGALGENAVGALHAISPAGDQIYFTAAATAQLYLRRGLPFTPETVRVSEPNAGFTDPHLRPAAFQEATPDGSRAFFLSSAELAQGADTGNGEEGKDLYGFNEDAPPGHRLTDLTPGVNSGTANGAEVQGLIGASSNGSTGYFVARGVLAAGGQPGEENLYRFEELAGRIELTFVAQLGGEREQGVGSFAERLNWSPRTYSAAANGAETELKTARVSANGDVLVFSTGGPLTLHQPNGANCATPNSSRVCAEIFRYVAPTHSLTCISCSPNGELPLQSSTFESLESFGSPVTGPEFHARVIFSNNVSSDGDEVFFQTAQGLVPSDTNGASECARLALYTSLYSCQDVYEWEAPDDPGGNCSSVEVNGGCLTLLSSGQSSEPSFFAGASADGTNAYILTASQLVPIDQDRAPDVYDVRVGGGSPAQQKSVVGSCVGESCLGPVAPIPQAISPGSALTNGPGNPKRAAHKRRRTHHKRRHHARKPRTGKRGGSTHTKSLAKRSEPKGELKGEATK
jgi:hypothetical protein